MFDPKILAMFAELREELKLVATAPLAGSASATQQYLTPSFLRS